MAKSLKDKMIDQGIMMVFRNLVGDALKSDVVKSAKSKLKEALGEPANKSGKRKKDEV